MLQVFGDITFKDNNSSDKNWKATLDVFGAYQFDQDNTAIVEIVAEKFSGESRLELERWWFKHRFNDSFSASLGRFHTPISYWNKKFHHGVNLQDTVDRPFYLEFEDDNGFLPIHVVGSKFSGDFWTKNSTISYEVFLANNQKIEQEKFVNGNSDVVVSPQPTNLFGDKIFTSLGFSVNPHKSPLQFSIYASEQPITADELDYAGLSVVDPTVIFDQRLLSFDVFGRWQTIDLIAEYLRIETKDLLFNSGTFESSAAYIQFTYKLNSTGKLILRTASLDYSDQDPYYQLLSVEEKQRNSIGYKHNFKGFFDIKLQYSRNKFRDISIRNDNELLMQVAFFIP